MPSKEELIRLFQELTELLTLDEGSPATFRVRAYENATETIRSCQEDLSEMKVSALAKMEGIGKSTAARIREYFDSGRIDRLEDLRKKYPADFVALVRIPGLGPKTLMRLRDELGVENLEGLRQAITDQKIRALKGMGAKSEEKLAKAIERIGSKQDRRPIAKALPLAETLVAEIMAIDGVEQAQYAGSLRRFRETVADIDIVVASANAAPVMEHFVNMPRVTEVLGHGDTKSSVVTDVGIQVDLRVVQADSYGAALLYFTGSKAHNIKLRQRAIEQGYTLNEYGLAELSSGKVVASKTEESIYQALKLDWIAPEMREDSGELEAAADSKLPRLLEIEDLKGDLHVHCDFSKDAKSSVEEMVKAASDLGYQYLTISDHGENLSINGVSSAEHVELEQRLAALRLEYPEMLLLHGCELNIAKDGSLDYTQKERNEFGLCVASVHSHFDLASDLQTERLITAMRDPSVRVLGHPLGRSLGSREAIEVDVEAILQAAIEYDVAIEVNAALTRLDAPAEMIRRGCELGNLFAVNSDAHHASHLSGVRFGVIHSHRGWLPRDRVINTWEPQKFSKWLSP